jgi:hypothetical protein
MLSCVIFDKYFHSLLFPAFNIIPIANNITLKVSIKTAILAKLENGTLEKKKRELEMLKMSIL